MRVPVNQVKLLSLVVACVLCFCLPLSATSIVKAKLRCPVCGKKFQVWVVATTNNFGGQDTDFYSCASGASPVPFSAHICPKCFYAGYRTDFGSDVKFEDSIKAILRKQLGPPPGFSKPVEANSWPPWLKFEQIMRTYQVLHQPAEDIAYVCLRASWCVRMREVLYGVENEMSSSALGLSDSLIKASGGVDGNPAKREVTVGRELFHKVLSPSYLGNPAEPLAAIYLLRSHGENEEVLTLIPYVEQHLTMTAFETLRDSLQNSIALERYYQRLAINYFTMAIKENDDCSELPLLLYLTGELNRRLGDYSEARRLFKLAIQQASISDELDRLFRDQLALVDSVGKSSDKKE